MCSCSRRRRPPPQTTWSASRCCQNSHSPTDRSTRRDTHRANRSSRMERSQLLLAIIATIGLAAQICAAASTYVVPKNANLSQFINGAQDGDTLILEGGVTFDTRNAVVTKSLTFASPDGL